LAPFPPQSEHLGERDDQGHHGQSDDAAPCETRYHGDLHARELWEGVGRSARVHGATAADEARIEVNPMKSSIHRVGHRVGNLASRTTTHLQMVESSEDKDGGRYRIRTCDFHRVNLSVLVLQRLTRPRGLPKYAEVVQDIRFCGFGCGLENLHRGAHPRSVPEYLKVCTLEPLLGSAAP
jgi:hypothetical protein